MALPPSEVPTRFVDRHCGSAEGPCGGIWQSWVWEAQAGPLDSDKELGFYWLVEALTQETCECSQA